MQDEADNPEFSLHIPVMLREVQALASKVLPLERYVDCTVGAGGHAQALLSEYPELECIGIDADPEACQRAAVRLSSFGSRVHIINAFFDEGLETARTMLDGRGASFILFDLGVSSYQLGASGRGFSFRADEPLDMRMSPALRTSAEDLIHQLDEETLADIIYRYGEERYSRRIARAIVAARRRERIRTSSRLAEIIAGAVPPAYRHGRIHPATRTFQALRIAVNDELGRIERALRLALELLAVQGVCAVISFHSLEDRIVKQIFAESAKTGHFSLEWKKPLTPADEETRNNPPSRSAKFRAIRAADCQSRSASIPEDTKAADVSGSYGAASGEGAER